MSNYRMVPGLMTEEIDQELLVCDTDLAVVHRVSGPAADVLRQVLATDAPVALEDDEVTSGLVAAGVLVAAGAPEREVGRRSFVRGAAAVGAIGVVTLALPRAAAASSVGGSGEPLPAAPTRGITVTYITTGPDSGILEVNWRSIPEAFSYDYVITITDESDPNTDYSLTGRLNSSLTPTEIYKVPNPGAISVQFTSITSDAVVVTLPFTLPST